MYIDLNVPIPEPPNLGTGLSKKQKGKQPQTRQEPPAVIFTPAQLAAIESRIDLLVHCQPNFLSV